MRTTARTIAAVAVLPMLVVTVWLALTSDHLEWPVASALYWGYLTAAPMLIGLHWCRRRPASRFGPLLVAFGVVSWVVSWTASDWRPAFDLAGFAGPLLFALTLYLPLAFPIGRLEPPAARWLLGLMGFGFLVGYPVAVLFSPALTGGGAQAICAPNCPENLLQVGSDPTLVRVTDKVGVSIILAAMLGVVVVHALRLRAATPPQRRASMAVAATSILFLSAFFAFQLAKILGFDRATVDTLEWSAAFGLMVVPLGFLIALIQAELFAARALRTLLHRLAARPTPDQWREELAAALDDDGLRLGFRDPVARSFHEPDGAVLERPAPAAGRAWVPIDRDAQPVAAMVLDETLAEDPGLVDAAATATLVAVENGALEAELQATRAAVLEAGDAARRRIGRDIHDTAQQRLVALRIQLTLAGEELEAAEDRARLERLDAEVQRAVDELRSVAHGATPEVLGRDGIGPALHAAVAHSPMPVRIHAAGVGRHAEAVEAAVYSCCLECLQNAAKHAGREASVTVHLSQYQGHLSFTVEDDGVGFDPDTVQRGAGLDNLAERVAALGGTLKIDSRPRRGTRVTGHLPA